MKSLFFAIISLTLFTSPILAAEKSTGELQTEIQRLREENQALRRLLALKDGESSQTKKPTPKVEKNPNTAESKSKYWLSPSGKRHNEKCRYYGTGNGKSCAAKDGTACKLCGG